MKNDVRLILTEDCLHATMIGDVGDTDFEALVRVPFPKLTFEKKLAILATVNQDQPLG